MKDPLLVHRSYCFEQVANQKGSTFLGQFSPWAEDVIDLSITAQFHHNIDVVCIGKVAVIFDDVGML